MKEDWKDVIGFEDAYRVSNLGRVKSKTRIRIRGHKKNGVPVYVIYKERIMRLNPDNDGYPSLTLSNKRTKKHIKVQRLVAMAFLEKNINSSDQICHKDGNRENNRVYNLYVGNQETNTMDKYRHRTTKLTPDQVIEIRRLCGTISQRDIAKRYGICQQSVSLIKNKINGKYIPDPDWAKRKESINQMIEKDERDTERTPIEM